MALDENISHLIGRIYDSVEDPHLWEEVLLELRSLLNASFILETVADLRHHELSRSTFYGGGTSRFLEGATAYEEELYHNDPSFHWAARHPHARYCDTSEIMAADEWRANEFVRYTSSRMGSSHWLIGYTAPEDELAFGLSIHPPAEIGPVPEQEKRLFKLLFEHMERAVRLASRTPLIPSESEALVVIDRLGQVREISPAAQRIVAEGDGLCVSGRNLVAADSSSTRRLNAAILSALRALRDGGFGGAVSLPRPSGKRDLLVTVVPLLNPHLPFQSFRPAALMRITEPGLTVSPSTSCHWVELFGLTPSETRLAETLMGANQQLRRAADELGITYETARVHLKRLMEKTETHSQAQLARLLSRIG